MKNTKTGQAPRILRALLALVLAVSMTPFAPYGSQKAYGAGAFNAKVESAEWRARRCSTSPSTRRWALSTPA